MCDDSTRQYDDNQEKTSLSSTTMPHYHPSDDVYSSDAHMLAPPSPFRKPGSSRHNLSARRSSTSLRNPSSLSLETEEDSDNGRHHSLAHELAVALMPEPSAGSKLLAEEFGIEFDEGAEGIDEAPNTQHHSELRAEDFSFADPGFSDPTFADPGVSSFASELASSAGDASSPYPEHGGPGHETQEYDYDHDDPSFSSATPSSSRSRDEEKKPEQDAMLILAQDLESTEKFLGHLRSLDADHGSGSQQQHVPALEGLTSDIIGTINASIREREGHVRDLLEYDREIKKIAAALGGSDILGQLDELPFDEDLIDKPPRPDVSRNNSRNLEPVEEVPRSPTVRYRHSRTTSDWDFEADRRLGDDEDDTATEPATSPIKDTFPAPPPLHLTPTPASVVPQLNHLRTITSSLVSSLSTISEQAQVNGAATTEAGRKIRALKNKIGTWRTEWDSAERSRVKIERWEAGIIGEGDGGDSQDTTPMTPTRVKRIDGRKIVEEHLRAFKIAVEEASLKTQAIMAR